MEIYAIDVTHRSAVQEFIADVEGHLSIYGVVNAAGVVQFGTITDVSEDDWNRVLDVNLKGSYIVCQETIPSLMRRGVGAIVNLASVSGRTRSIYAAPNYAASKAGVIGLTMALAAQHASSGIRVNCVAPGVINTPMIAGYSDEQRAAIIESIPLGRIGSSQEVANVIVSLLSERWSYVTGQTINVNGGLFMH